MSVCDYHYIPDLICDAQSDDSIPIDYSLDWLDELKSDCDKSDCNGSIIANHIAKGIVTVDFSRLNADDALADIVRASPAASSIDDADEVTEEIKSITRFEPYVTDEMERTKLFLTMLWGFHRTGFWASPDQFETKFCRKG